MHIQINASSLYYKIIKAENYPAWTTLDRYMVNALELESFATEMYERL